jgi:hypothetical protein
MTGNYSNRWIKSSALIAALCLSACGEFAYKRGASASDLEVTRKTCSSKNADKLAVEKCMTDNGWVVQSLDGAEPIISMQSEPEPFIEASITEDNRQTKQPSQNSKGTASDKVNSSAVIKKTADPMDTFKIGSWWKLGAGADNLQNSIQTCVTALGDAHQPEAHSKIVTRVLLLCMKEKGWHGLLEK